jgi:hypothetical protein
VTTASVLSRILRPPGYPPRAPATRDSRARAPATGGVGDDGVTVHATRHSGTHPTDAFDTAELELRAPAEPPATEVEPGRPSWEPDEGDFN